MAQPGELIRDAVGGDLAWLLSVDAIDPAEVEAVVRRGRVLVAERADAGQLLGFLRWGLFWDHVPMMNLLRVNPEVRGQGIGRRLVSEWERRRAADGHSVVLTSTQADESAQHFYRAIGYCDAGALLYPGQATELFFTKTVG